MNIAQSIESQFLSSLEMLKEAIQLCPDSLWDDPQDHNRTWNLAYHTLFYLHLYLQDQAEGFTPWVKHRKENQILPWPPHDPSHICEPYNKSDLLEYLTFCQEEIKNRMPQIDFSAPSGFAWLPFDKLELQLYSLRHVHQHTGELMERLGSRAGVNIRWVSKHPV